MAKCLQQGCKAYTTHKSGFCKDCRRTKCQKCQRTFSPYRLFMVICGYCKVKIERWERHNSNAYDL